MRPQWTVVIQLAPGVQPADARVSVAAHVKAAGGSVARVPSGDTSLLAFAADRAAAEALAARVRRLPLVDSAYVKPPEALP